MKPLIESFWIKLEGVLRLLVVRLLSKHTDCKFYIGSSHNNTFPLRAYLTIFKDSNGNEITISVDIKNQKDGLLIESDVVGEDGMIIADGPSLALYGDFSASFFYEKTNEWFTLFDLLFIEKSTDIDTAIKNLTASQIPIDHKPSF